MPESDFERRLGTLLHQTAADIPPELDVSARVQQKYYATGGRRWIAVASMVAIVALLAGTFTWFRGTGFRLGAGAITLHIDAAYADATATVVTFHLTGPRTDVVYAPVGQDLTDAAGNSLPFLSGGGDSLGSEDAFFAPLPQQALGVRQTLTLTITNLYWIPLHMTDGAMSTNTDVRGMWEAQVAVTPIAGTATTLQIPAQTHGKLSIQPLRLDVSPGALYNYLPGGVRIVLRMSGLTPGAQQFPSLATGDPNSPQGNAPGGDPNAPGGATSGSGGQSSLSAAGDSSGILPKYVVAVDAQGMPLEIPETVDASGAIELELIYRQPLQGPLTLTFDSITLNSGETIHGPWEFTLSVG